MIGYNFSKFDPRQQGKTKFEQLLDVFMQLLTYTNGDVAEALQWMNQLDKEYQMTDAEYGMGDFIQEDHAENGTRHSPEITRRDFRQAEENKTRRSPYFQTWTR